MMAPATRATIAFRGAWLLVGLALAISCVFAGAALVSTYSHPPARPATVRQANANLLAPVPVTVEIKQFESDSGQVCPARQATRVTIDSEIGAVKTIHC